ncbi:GNAT family N-acetyltransferase [Serratia grimesii]|jgi:GNAT superfamily N-acetyltransferase|uniref:GNAT family N-acetyltransferase n=1 Tax=Serratia grimesii TaxID=82995 RepID=UPI00077C6290|nr:GNAT family N-acetyltransferase [Serratia grimesii]CAI1146429.1 Predicted acetyltransferase [Serratia grimesii]CAI2523392.1 Predicted acetyltransferase [Serratia grimesii]SUI36368.1 Predicted acetyltransferase [Serratia grimesii]
MTQPILLQQHQLDLLWQIDRSEVIDTFYRMQNGKLQPYTAHYDLQGWDPHDRETYSAIHEHCFARGGRFLALFEEKKILAAAVLDTLPRGPRQDLRQLLFFYVSASQRGKGLGKRLFSHCLHQASQDGALGLYVSSIPSKNTVDFYLSQGCQLMTQPDTELFVREPEDIHLACYYRE